MNKPYNKIKFVICCFILIMISCKKDVIINPTPKHGIEDVTKINTQVAEKWIDLLRNIIANESIDPPRAARVFAYTSITMYESVVDGIAGNKSLQGQLNGFNLNVISANSDSLDYEIILTEAIAIVSKNDTIIPNINEGINQKDIDSINSYYDRIIASKNGNVLDSIIQKSKARGALIARAIINYAATDNFLSIKNLNYIVPVRDASHPAYWTPTDNAHLIPTEPFWGQVRSFTMSSSDQFEIPQAILFDADTSSAFGRQAREVYNTVNNRTMEQSDIRLWWSDATGTQTPAGHWMGMLKYIFHVKNYKLDKAVELYALTAITTADAFISCWDAKYQYNLLRPETYIKDYIQGGWSTGQFDITPPFPEYPSGHSVCSGAAEKVLSNAVGVVAFTDSINANIGYTPRNFNAINDAADEAGISRLYGGIHFREAIENGLLQGRNLGQNVITKIHFR